MIDKTRWPLNADLFPKENMSMTSEMVQGHSDVGLRDKLKTSGTKQRLCGDIYVFIISDTAIMMFMTKMLLLRFECGSVTRTALENSENYHVSGFASGSFHAVCPRAPNVGRRGSELHQFLQRPDHRLLLTKRVCCQAIGLRVTTCPLFCRNFDVVRLLRRNSTATTACEPARDNPCAKVSSAHGLDTSRLSEEEQLPGPIRVSLGSLRKTVASSFSGPGMCHAFSRAHVAIVEANTCQPVMFALANWP